MSNEKANIEEVGHDIFNAINLTSLAIHAVDHAFGISKTDRCILPGLFIKNPKVSTGGGDNFNCGFCFGQLLGRSIKQSLMLGNAMSSFYVKNGYSPSLEELLAYLPR
jgi:sugar/nucleoside kinase (ribokinase family)